MGISILNFVLCKRYKAKWGRGEQQKKTFIEMLTAKV